MRSARLPRAAAVLAAVLAAWVFLAGPAPAADPAGPDTSLKLVPADAAFYSSMLRNKEQMDLVANSEAWAKLWSLPAVRQAWKAVKGQYNDPNGNLAPFHQFMEDEDNQDLVAMLGDAASDEVFCYGDDGWADLFDLYQQVYNGIQYQPLIGQLDDKTGGRAASDVQARAVLSVLAKNLDHIKAPNLVVGFKVSDADRAEKQIQRLEKLARALSRQLPELKDRVKRTKVGDASFLTLTLDGSQIPWDNIPWKQLENKRGEFAPLLRKLKGLTLTVSLGVDQGYLVLAVGPSTDYLSTLGGKGPRLGDRPEFKPLEKVADKKLTSIGYSSKAFLEAVAEGNARRLDALVELAKVGLAKADLTDEERTGLLKHLTDLTKAAEAAEGGVGAVVSFDYLTDRGYEGYTYDHGKHPGVDGSKPLTLLDHLGGAPLLAVVGRGVVSVEDYEKMVQTMKDAFPELDKIAMEKLNGKDKERYEQAKEDFLPLLQRLDETTGKRFLPALKDGQFALVLDAKWTSKRWLKAMPETDEAMPMPELGIVMGVSDAESLRKAMTEYREIVNDALTKMKEWPGGDKVVGDFQVPAPKAEKTKSGTLYSYPLPPEWGLDRKVLPTAGLSDSVAALTLSHSHADRLLASHPLKLDGGPLADHDKPLAGATYLDWAGLVDAATPWVEYATAKALESQGKGPPGETDAPAKDHEAILSQVRTVLDVLKCFRGATSAATVEDGVLVTHRESVFKDLEK